MGARVTEVKLFEGATSWMDVALPQSPAKIASSCKVCLNTLGLSRISLILSCWHFMFVENCEMPQEHKTSVCGRDAGHK